VNGVGVPRHPGNLSVRFEGYVAHDVLAALQPKLAASTGSACTSGIQEPSHVLNAIGLSDMQANASIRFSLGRFVTDAEINQAVNLVRDVLPQVLAAA
jgi:cysteine desulfurase